MAHRGAGIPKRRAVLEAIGREDPARYEELMALRHYNPQGYRKEIRRVMARLEEPVAPLPFTPLPPPGGAAWQAREVSGALREVALAPPVDLSPLDGALTALREALDTGALDRDLVALLHAEREGRGRKGAIQAIERRMGTVK
ncbi:MAG: hypothetical protein JXX28_16640 [Deltaproteobacteria bacterium]|nr:hypothetical protein [Deltaproteobacteria bacterium]